MKRVRDEDVTSECIHFATKAIKYIGLDQSMRLVRKLGPLTIERILANPTVTLETCKLFYYEQCMFRDRTLRPVETQAIPLLKMITENKKRQIGDFEVKGHASLEHGTMAFDSPTGRIAIDLITGRKLPYKRVLFHHHKWIGIYDEYERLNVYDPELGIFLLPQTIAQFNYKMFMIRTRGNFDLLKIPTFFSTWVLIDRGKREIKMGVENGKNMLRLRKYSTHRRMVEYVFRLRHLNKLSCFEWEDHYFRYWVHDNDKAREMSCNLREFEEYQVRLALRESGIPTDIYPNIVSYLTNL